MEQETVLELFDRYADMVYRIALSYLLRRKRRTLCRLFFLNCWRAA